MGREQRCDAKYGTTSVTVAATLITHEFPCNFNFFFSLCWVHCRGSSDEQKFLEASMAYVSGKPIMSDKEFDQLKLRLKVCYFQFFYQNGVIAHVNYRNGVYGKVI